MQNRHPASRSRRESLRIPPMNLRTAPTIRVGVLGFGRMGAIHAEAVVASPAARLVAVCDTSVAARDRAARLHRVPVFDDLAHFLGQSLDAVIIASNTQYHARHIAACADAGVAIFTEKPVGLTSEESDRVLAVVERARVPFQIGYQRRWDAGYLEMKRLIDAGEIGRPVYLKSYGRDPDASSPANWGFEKNGGLFVNCAIHDYDLARFLFGQEIQTVSATGAVAVYHGLAEVGDIDTCSTTLALSGGAIAVTEWTRFASYGYDVAAEVIGTDGALQLGGARAEGLAIRRRSEAAGSVLGRFGQAFRSSIDEFAAAVREERLPSPGVHDARTALQVALAARESYMKGSVTVQVPLLKAISLDGRGADSQAGKCPLPTSDDVYVTARPGSPPR